MMNPGQTFNQSRPESAPVPLPQEGREEPSAPQEKTAPPVESTPPTQPVSPPAKEMVMEEPRVTAPPEKIEPEVNAKLKELTVDDMNGELMDIRAASDLTERLNQEG